METIYCDEEEKLFDNEKVAESHGIAKDKKKEKPNRAEDKTRREFRRQLWQLLKAD